MNYIIKNSFNSFLGCDRKFSWASKYEGILAFNSFLGCDTCEFAENGIGVVNSFQFLSGMRLWHVTRESFLTIFLSIPFWDATL